MNGRHDVAAAALLLALTVSGCGRPDAPAVAVSGGRAAPATGTSTVRVVALGDSLTAGLGLDPDEAYPSLLQARLRSAGSTAEVINAGVSGDTSAGGLRRLDWSLDGGARVLIVALGGNDGLRGLAPAELRRNLGAIIERAQARHVTVILAGMEAPPNFGRVYTADFRQVYRDLAATYRVAFLPFLLDGVAGIVSLNQGDGIHPNATGARKVAENLWPLVERAVKDTQTP